MRRIFMGYAIMRLRKIKSMQTISAAIKHNHRQKECKSVVQEDKKNPILKFSKMCEETKLPYKKFLKNKTQGQKIRKNAVLAVEVILTFSSGAISDENIKPWIEKSAEFLANNFGGWGNIYDISYHADETSPHLHALLTPIDEKGKLNATHFLGGSKKLIQLQDRYAEDMKAFGLERGKSKQTTKAEHISSYQWHKQQAQKSAELEAYKKLFGEPIDFSLDDKLNYYDSYNKTFNKMKQFDTELKVKYNDIEK